MPRQNSATPGDPALSDNLLPGEPQIREQLDRVLGSPTFVASRRLADFLTFITERTLQGRSDSIQQISIAREVYQRDDGFDPASDPLVRVEATRLRKSLAQYYQGDGSADPVLIEIPLRSYVPRFISPDGPSEASGLAPVAETPAAQWQLPSVGVLRFSCKESEPLDDQLLLEEILVGDLSLFPTIRALAFTDSGRDGAQRDNLEQARRQGMDFGVVGMIQQSDTQVRIEIATLDVESGEQIWSSRHAWSPADCELIDFLYRVSRETSAQVADAYGAVTRRMAGKLRENPPAEAALYEAALRFFDSQMIPGDELLAQCLAVLERAAPYSTRSAEYFAILGFCQADTNLFCEQPDSASLDQAYHNIRHAVAMDPTSAIVHYARAFSAMLAGDIDTVRDAARRMVECLPNSAFMLGCSAFFLATIGDHDRAMEHYRESLELNLRHPAWFHLVPCFDHFQRGEFELALKAVNQIGLNDFFWEQLLKASLLGHLGRSGEAAEQSDRLLAYVPDFTRRSDEIIAIYALHPPLAMRVRRGLELAGTISPN